MERAGEMMAVQGIGVQTKEVIDDACPELGFRLLKEAGFSHVDFSLNDYMRNTDIYKMKNSHFFDKSLAELEAFFSPISRRLRRWESQSGRCICPILPMCRRGMMSSIATCGRKWLRRVCSSASSLRVLIS